MSHSHGAVTETSLDFSGLRVVVTGTSDRGAEFIRFAAGFQSERAPSPGSSAGSFEAVSETPPSAVPSSRAGLGLESREEIVSTFPGCPQRCVALVLACLVPLCLAVTGCLVLGWLDFGQRLCWILASSRRTVRRRWNCGLGSTPLFVLTIWIALSSIVPLHPTGGSPVRWWQGCTWLQQVSKRPASVSCLDPGCHVCGFDGGGGFEFCQLGHFWRMTYRTLCARMALSPRLRWSCRSHMPCGFEKTGGFPGSLAPGFYARGSSAEGHCRGQLEPPPVPSCQV